MSVPYPAIMVQAGDRATLAEARERVIERIAVACRRSGRDPGSVQLVAVTKTVAPERIREGIAVGLTTFGENRVQEAGAKVLAVAGATWHLIGPLQSNKARRAVELFDAIETVDSVALARRLDRLAGELRPGQGLPALIQVNVDRDPAKAGIDPAELDHAFDDLEGLANLRIDGLMTVGQQVASREDARPTFAALRELSDRLRPTHAVLGPALSMGMTDDFEVAIEEGATIVRIGRALFGERPHHHDGDHDADHAP
jgi:pyridoxal phosphate enzyme (YggS family)